MFFGPQSGEILEVRPVSIHDQILYDIVFRLDADRRPRLERLAPESVPSDLKVGDRVRVKMVMDTVTAMERESSVA